jgi:transposase
VFNLLEEGHTIILVNAHHRRAVPGRKTDSKDAEWIADLLRHGLRHRPVSFPPSPPVIYAIWCAIAKPWCKNGRRDQSLAISVLETATSKLSSVGSSVLGKSGRRRLSAMIEGVSDARAAG